MKKVLPKASFFPLVLLSLVQFCNKDAGILDNWFQLAFNLSPAAENDASENVVC